MHTRIDEPRPPLRAAAAAFAAMLSVYFFSYFNRAAIPGTIFNELQSDLGLSAAAVAALGSMFTWIYGGMQVAVGLLADRYGGARALLGGGLAMLAGALLFPLSRSAAGLFAARALTGFGASFMYLSIIRELGRLFAHRHFAALVGVMLAVGYTGGMTGTLPFERAAAAFGWRRSLFAAALLLMAALAGAGLILRRLGPEPRAARALSLAPLAAVWRRRACRPLFATSVILFPIFFVIQTVLGKKFLQDFAGLNSPAAAAFILVMTFVSVASVVAGGLLPRALGDRRRPLLAAGALILLAATGVLLGGTLSRAPGWVFLAGYALLALSGISSPSITATMKELNPPESAAAAISVINGIAYISCGTIGQVGGLILGRYRDSATVTATGVIYPPEAYVSLCAFLAALAVLNLVFTALIPETRGRHADLAEPVGSSG